MPNRLQFESSPYLLQHAHNPVDWYPWGAEAFEKAKREHKPVLVSIGYAACHWCHVMEKESFEHDEVAAFMNEHFVNIKVDREEHPDVDHFYMDALQASNGSGGWPLNMFVTPDRMPFYGGTYFPPQRMYQRASWMEILEAIQQAWLHRQDDINVQSEQLVQHLKQASVVASASEKKLDKEWVAAAASNLLKQADAVHGGFGAAPKFPGSMAIVFLLQHDHFFKQENAKQHALFSLDKMIQGGIYDQLGGGFARYATDNDWLVPHFEKMLYDNALLVSAMSVAYRVTGEERYRDAIDQTISFCNRELRAMQGFCCALDADSEGVEGKYYTWTYEEWQEVLPDAHPALNAYYGVSPEGNWEETNILSIVRDEAEICDRFNLQPAEWSHLLNESNKRLFEAREKRIRPGLDDKILLSWNALMNIALTDAAIALDKSGYSDQASDHMAWLLEVFYKDGSLLHVAKEGAARIAANLDDYAYLIKALLQLGSTTGNVTHLNMAESLLDYVRDHFSDEQQRFFYFTDNRQQDVPVRKTEIYDGATPSANSCMLENLLLAANIFERIEWMVRAEQMMQGMADSVMRHPSSFANWACTMQRYVNGLKQLVIVGPDAYSLKEEWENNYHPDIYAFALRERRDSPAFLNGKDGGDNNLLYLCERFSCKAPFSSVKDLLKAGIF